MFYVKKLPFNKEALISARKKSLRTGNWAKALNRIERGIVDLTIRFVDRISSGHLLKTLMKIISKLENASKYMIRAEISGRILAEKMGRIAYLWGNLEAARWKDDVSYIICLGLNSMSSIWYKRL